MTWRDRSRELGRGSLYVIALDDTVYAAPDRLFHYVQQHHYVPPDVFVDTMAAWPPDLAYLKRLERLGLEWKRVNDLPPA